MPERSPDEEFQLLAYEFSQYLSDQIAPLLAADSVESLLKCSPDFVAAHILSWVNSQYRMSSSLSVSDYLFHAVKKIHMVGEYRLLPQENVKRFIDELKPHILRCCPPNEQELLARSLSAIDSVTDSAPARLDVVYGTTKADSKSASPPPRASNLESELGQIGIFLERLKRELGGRAAPGDVDAKKAQRELVSDVLVQTARASRNASDLEKAFEYVRGIGIQADTNDVIRALGRSLPEWRFADKENFALPEDKNLSALHRIVVEAPDAKEAGTRFHQMIQTVIERLNDGHLQQAANMIALAEKMIAAKEVDQNLVDNLRNRGHEEIDLEKLRKYAESAEEHPQLQKILNFFSGLTPEGLLEMLRQETKRERRRLIMAIIEAHREDARKAAVARLRVPFSQNFSTEEGYFRRNLLHLLRRIPPASTENETELIEIIARHTDLDFPLIVTKEAISYLGQFKHREAEETLKALLTETESLLTSGKGNYDPKELLALLDRICGALARVGTTSSRKILLDHAFSRKTKMGDTMNRLVDLSSQDLSADKATLERLLSALHSCLPRKLLGFVVSSKDEDLKKIVQALSGTPSPSVRQVFEDLKRRYPESPAAQLAAGAFQAQQQQPQQQQSSPDKRNTSVEAVSSLEGDLQIFGLPGLLQNLNDHGLSGTVTLKRPDQEILGTLELSSGKLISCRVGSLTDETAIYQLLERPEPGKFEFVSKVLPGDSRNSKELLPLLLEGVRRYDELTEARTILPDHVRLAGSGLQPAVLPEEKDGILFRDLWNVVRKGATPLECEAAVVVDSYRIRRLLVHWFQTGSITIVY